MKTPRRLIRPPALNPGATIGIFTPSFPAHVKFREKYLHGIEVLKRMGFHVLEGSLTASHKSEGYRSGSPRERADEFMGLIRNPKVSCMISTIGGSNSSSMIPYLDFDEIRANPKIICGYSDVTSLHLSILAYSGLSTFYGPAVMPSFGEWPDLLPETRDSFLAAVQETGPAPRKFTPPARWSTHLRSALTDAWKTEPRRFEPNPGWRSLHPGEASAPILVANLNTLMSSAGTSYFPDLNGKILLLEEMSAPLSLEERSLRHLERLGVFESISGLIVSKPEMYQQEDAPFGYDELILEIVGTHRKYPIITQFDCGHVNPTLTLAEMTQVSISAHHDHDATFTVLEPMVTS
ncbi:MAG: LD-carboxypeptidase [Methylotenera sp.]|nr:LD-carboxypeptidase [Oligoflexia bacterium]